MELWSLATRDEDGIHVSLHTSLNDAYASLRENYDTLDEFAQWENGYGLIEEMSDELGIEIFLELHKVAV